MNIGSRSLFTQRGVNLNKNILKPLAIRQKGYWTGAQESLRENNKLKKTRKLDAKMDKNTDSYEIDFLSQKHFLD